MKAKHLAIVTVLLLAAIAGMTLKTHFPEHQRGAHHLILRVAYPNTLSVTHFDPAHIDTVVDANVVRNLYGRLVEYSQDGQIVPALAERFDWKGSEIHFLIRSGLRTTEGWPITAEDAALSFKRLMIKGTNTHGDLTGFLCPGHKIHSIQDSCPGIRTEGNTLILKPARASQGKFLVPLLASVDFSIIPRNALLFNSPNLDIGDYRNTSGAYHLEKDDSNGALLLKANEIHYYYSPEMAQTVQFVPVKGEESVEKFVKGEVDLITTADLTPISKLIELKDEFPDLSIHRTLNIKNWVLQFTRAGQKHLNVDQRIIVGKNLRKIYLENLDEEDIDPSIEFFPTFGEGSLDPDQIKKLQEIFAAVSLTKQPRKWTLTVGKYRIQKFQDVFRSSNLIEVRPVSAAPWKLPEADQPDMYVGHIDAAFFEDISMISYNADIGTFGLSRKEGAHWLMDYMEIEDKVDRLKLLRNLHYQALSNATVIPLGSAPYVAVARAPWKIHFSKYFAGSPLWLVKIN